MDPVIREEKFRFANKLKTKKEDEMRFSKIRVLMLLLGLFLWTNSALAGGCGSIIYVDDGSGSSSSGGSSNTWQNEPSYVPSSDGGGSSGGKPDFIVPELYVTSHKKIFRPGEDMKIKVRVKNNGDRTPNHEVKIKYWRSDGYQIDPKDDRKKLGVDDIKSSHLDPGESKWEDKTVHAPSDTGVYNITVEADSNDQINEIHESNNYFNPPYVFEVKIPNLLVQECFIVGGRTEFSPREVFSLKVFSKNSGTEPEHDAKVYYYLDGVKIGDDNMRDYNLEPGDTAKEEDIYITAPQDSGPHILYVKIDSENQIHESDENDNDYTINFSVASPTPSFEFAYVQACENVDTDESWFRTPVGSKSVFNSGETIHLLAKIENLNTDRRWKAEVYRDGTYQWTTEWDWTGVSPIDWDYDFFTMTADNPVPGAYTFKVYLDVGQGYQFLGAADVQVLDNGPVFRYDGSLTCEQLTYHEDNWTYDITGKKGVFNSGEDINFLATLADVRTNHKMKVEIYHNGDYSWTWEDPAFRQVDGFWSWSYAPVTQSSAQPGTYTFKTYVDSGASYQYLGSADVQVLGDVSAFSYEGSVLCEELIYHESELSYEITSRKTIFESGDDINFLVTLADVRVNHKIKVEIYHDESYSWAWQDSAFRQVSGVWSQSYAAVTQSSAPAGAYTFKVFLDIGTGWQLIDTVNADAL